MICSTVAFSLRSGKNTEIRSTAERTSESTRCTSLTLGSSWIRVKPLPSRQILVSFLIPARDCTDSSIFWQIPLSTSSGVAPG